MDHKPRCVYCGAPLTDLNGIPLREDGRCLVCGQKPRKLR